MTFNLQWEGRATDFIPELLKTVGKPGPVADAAKVAIWETVQATGERDPQAWVRVSANGWEDEDPGLGRFTMTLQITAEPSAISQKVADQQPVDLRGSSLSAPDPARVPPGTGRGT